MFAWRGPVLAAVAGAALVAGGGGCGGFGEARRQRQSGGTFTPEAIRIHPLTHIEVAPPAEEGSGKRRGGGDASMLILHLEVTDGWSDTIKAMGSLRVDLFRPGAGVAPGIETQTLAWDVTDLMEPETNSRRFDRATRTYRLPLRGPAWMATWLDREAAARENRPAWLKVRAVFQPLELEVAEGEARPAPVIMRDEFVIQR